MSKSSIASDRLGYSLVEGARILGISDDTLRRLGKAGVIRLVKIRNRTVIPADDLRSLLDGGTDARLRA
jgi:excisionase family DNA binding protein